MTDPRGPWSRLRRASGGFRHGMPHAPSPAAKAALPVWRRRLRHAAIWLALALALAIGYSYRAELGDVADRLRGELVPYAAVTTEEGALRVRAQPDGHFYVDTLVDGQAIRFLVDTGASTVSLSRDDALRLGHDLGRLDFSRRIQTAGGVVRGAPVLLRRVELGETAFTNVRAIVNEQPMPISLLGVNALDRFESYEVRDGILTLRP